MYQHIAAAAPRKPGGMFMQSLRSLALLLCGIFAFYVPLASAHFEQATITCSAVTFNYTFFTNSGNPPVTGGTATESITIDGNTVLANKPVAFSGVTFTDVVPITIPDSGPHVVVATVVFQGNDGYGAPNGLTQTNSQTLSGCPAVCQPGTPNPAGGHASGNGYDIYADALGLILIPKQPLASSSQTGVGTDQHYSHLIALNLSPLANIDLLPVTSRSTVDASLNTAENETAAETTNVSLLSGVITADVVRADADAIAAGDHSAVSTAGSTFANLVIGGVKYANVPTNTTVKLTIPGSPGAYAILNEIFAATTTPAAGTLSGGTYAADVTVNMIHVFIPGLLGAPSTEIIVSHAVAHADFPQTKLCPGGANQSVSGHAFVLGANLLGIVQATEVLSGPIPSNGGSASASTPSLTLPQGLATLTTVSSNSQGKLNPTSSTASSQASVANVSLLNGMITATAVETDSGSSASAGTSQSSPAGTKLLNITVAGQSFGATPPANTTITLPGLGFVVLNEQIPDAPQGGNHTGLTVRMIRVHIDTLGGVIPGSEIIVAESHSDAAFQ
jgi:hypothetical protein